MGWNTTATRPCWSGRWTVRNRDACIEVVVSRLRSLCRSGCERVQCKQEHRREQGNGSGRCGIALCFRSKAQGFKRRGKQRKLLTSPTKPTVQAATPLSASLPSLSVSCSSHHLTKQKKTNKKKKKKKKKKNKSWNQRSIQTTQPTQGGVRERRTAWRRKKLRSRTGSNHQQHKRGASKQLRK